MSCRGAPAAKAAAAAASEFWTFIRARPLKVAGSRWVQASCISRRPCWTTIISPRSVGLSTMRLAAAAAVGVDHVAHLAARLLHREPDDLARALAPHLAHQRVVGVEHGVAVARHRLDDDRLDVGELLDGVDAAQAEVVGLHVEDDGDVVALVAESLAQDAAAGDLEDGEVDARVLQHHPCRPRAGGVGADHAAARR